MKRFGVFTATISLCLLMLPALAAAQEVPPNCGDGRIQWRQGETCEPPNTTINRGWYCDENCQSKPVRCGDGMVMGWEQCEFDGDCENFPVEICEECHCVPNPGFCGDGMVQWKRGENCEPGVGNECGPGRFCDPELCICREKTDGLEACCLPDGLCSDLTAQECAQVGGEFQGEGMDCASAICQPTAIELTSFTATPKARKVKLGWATGSEIDNLGFNIYRTESENGEYTQINDSLIVAEGSSREGASYEFVDEDVLNRNTYWYKLEDVDIYGTRTQHGPMSATPRLIYGIGNRRGKQDPR